MFSFNCVGKRDASNIWKSQEVCSACSNCVFWTEQCWHSVVETQVEACWLSGCTGVIRYKYGWYHNMNIGNGTNYKGAWPHTSMCTHVLCMSKQAFRSWVLKEIDMSFKCRKCQGLSRAPVYVIWLGEESGNNLNKKVVCVTFYVENTFGMQPVRLMLSLCGMFGKPGRKKRKKALLLPESWKQWAPINFWITWPGDHVTTYARFPVAPSERSIQTLSSSNGKLLL